MLRISRIVLGMICCACLAMTPSEAGALCANLEITPSGTRKLTRNWRVDGFLWKPRAEHYNGVVVVTLPRGRVKKVVVMAANPANEKRVSLPFRSVGDAGDAWADYNRNGRQYGKEFGGIIVEARSVRGKTRRFLIECPGRRSDGLRR